MSHVEKHIAGSPSWLDLATDDLEASRKFYAALFDWTFDIGPPATGGYTTCKVAGKQVAGMSAKPAGETTPSAWTVYLAVDDLDATCAKITEAGGTLAVAPMDVLEFGRMAIASDPTGGVFGMWQAKQHTGAQLVDEPGALSWSELNTRDLDTAKKFFTTVFGHDARPLPDPKVPYVTLDLGGKSVCGIMQMNHNWPAAIPAHWMPYFGVTDADATVARVKSLGGTVHVQPFDTPYGRIAIVEDPRGAKFSIVKPVKRA